MFVNFQDCFSDIFLHCLLVNFLDVPGLHHLSGERGGLDHHGRVRLPLPRLQVGLGEVVHLLVLVSLLGEEINSLKQATHLLVLLVEAELLLQVVDVLLHLLQDVRSVRVGFGLQRWPPASFDETAA